MSKKTLAWGFHALQSVLEWDAQRIISIWLDKNRDDARMRDLQAQLQNLGLQFQVADKVKLERMCQSKGHQGVVFEMDAAQAKGEKDLANDLDRLQLPGLYLLLDQVQDPHNFGACLRTADAVGVDGVIISKDNAVGLTPVVMKTSSGAFQSVAVYQVTNLRRSIDLLREKGFWVVGSSGAADKTVYQADLQGSIGIVLGAEGSGMRRLTSEACDYLIKIPMLGQVESLNVSVAAGVLLYEALRQRQL